MSYFQGFNELNGSLRSALIGILLIAPFWYVDINLLSNWAMNDLRIDLVIALSIILSISWLIVFVGITLFGTNLIHAESSQAEIMLAVFSSSSLGILSFIGYLLQLTILSFVIFSFSITVTIGVCLIILRKRKLKLKRHTQK